MDRLNLELRDLLQARARLAVAIATWKAERGHAVPDRTRERSMLAQLLEAPGPGFDRATLASLLRAIFAASRRHAVRAVARGGARPRTPTRARRRAPRRSRRGAPRRGAP